MLLKEPFKILPGYQCREIVQRGEIFDIYRAKRSSDGDTVLLKVLVSEQPPIEHVARLRHEFEIGRNLNAPQVMRPLALEQHNHRHGLVLENVKGCPITEVLGGQPMDLATFLKVAIGLSQALCVLHQHKIIHNRISARNVFVDLATTHVLLADLGMASRLSSEKRKVDVFDSADDAPSYMSPEQTGRINRDVDDRTDLYSLGVVFYEMLCGRPPFEEKEPIELIHAHIARTPAPLQERRPDIPEAVSQIVTKLLSKSVEDRYQTALRVKTHLQTCLSEFEQHGVVSIPTSGLSDVAERFRVPQKLYGRRREVAMLLSAFERASQSRSEVALISGPAGIGKSELINELSKSVAEVNGYFIAAKYVELQRNIPYSALIGAFSELVHQLLTESDTRKAYWKTRLDEALGANGRVITDVVHAVELITGPQPKLPELGPTESLNRFNMVWQQFTRAFASTDHPLLLFVDDLQWADAASLRLIQRLATDPRHGHLLLVSAYRDDEVGASHPLLTTFEGVESEGGNVTKIPLKALDADVLNLWVSDALNTDSQSAMPLAQLIFENTQGNPFFVIESLRTIDRHGLFELNPTLNTWEFDLEKVRRVLVPSDNVIDLFVHRIEDLSSSAKENIKGASCIGNTFDLTLLSEVRKTDLSQCGQDMLELIDMGLVQPVCDFDFSVLQLQSSLEPDRKVSLECRFLHDRVREAAYSLLTEEEKHKSHLRLGQLYRDRQGGTGELEDNTFAIVDHLNLAKTLVTGRHQTEELARFNFDAGHSAKSANAYDSARNYFSIGIELLSDRTWGEESALFSQLQLEMAECDYLTGRIDSAEERCDLLLRTASDDMDRLQVCRLKIILYTSRSRHEEALTIGVEGAKFLGMKLLESPGPAHMIKEFVRAKWALRGKKDKDLRSLPVMEDPLQLARMELLALLVAPAFQSNPVFAIVVALKMLNASLRYGQSAATPFSYMIYGVVNSAFGVNNLPAGDFASAYRFGRLALKLKDDLPHVQFGYHLHFLFATAINHWRQHVRSNIGHFESAYQGAMSAGDLVYADYSLVTLIVDGYFKGDTLDQVTRSCERYFDFYDRYKGVDRIATAQGQSALIHQQMVACLQGDTERSSSLTGGPVSEADLLQNIRDDSRCLLSRWQNYSLSIFLTTMTRFRQRFRR